MVMIGRRFVAEISSKNRSLRMLCNTKSTNIFFDMKTEKEEFVKALPRVIANVSNHPKFQDFPIANQWIEKVITGNVSGGKHMRGLTTVMAYKMIECPENITESKMQLARTLGWCTEILQSYCTVLDDIADNSLTRRGQPCWYRREDVGISMAINDATLLICALMIILKDSFVTLPRYIDIYHEFHESLFFTSIGQHLDLMYIQREKNYDKFTLDNYNAIVLYKTGYYTYKLPITLGILLTNKFEVEMHKNVEDVSCLMARLFQMQDDYIDCFGDVSITGKEGSDIQEGKCSWLAVNALRLCKPPQRTVFMACYGSKEPAHIERIKQLYIKLKLPEIFKNEEYEMYNNIINRVKSISSAAERELYLKVLNMTYNRKC